MIIEFSDLERYRHRVAMVDGAFDPIHQGHIAYFREAARLGAPVLCNIASDTYVKSKHRPLLSAVHRARVIDEMRSIDLTHVSPTDTESVLEELRPRFYVKGRDWEGTLPPRQVEICEAFGIDVVYVDTVQDSSTRILCACLGEARGWGDVDGFEARIHEQHKVCTSAYDEEYFESAWREGGNRYTIEARREIEGRNPELIRDTFRPRRVLDMGCGPGLLMYFLGEFGVSAHGIDFSERSRRLAPPEVRKRITIGDVADPALEDDSFDLVICREVFEHLTVLEIQRAVQAICRVSSRYVYATTRFHPAPETLLDFTDDRAVDPTHITLLNQDFLRLLFVMQGLRRRVDLEERMDWLRKGRVLVYEKGPGRIRETSG